MSRTHGKHAFVKGKGEHAKLQRLARREWLGQSQERRVPSDAKSVPSPKRGRGTSTRGERTKWRQRAISRKASASDAKDVLKTACDLEVVARKTPRDELRSPSCDTV